MYIDIQIIAGYHSAMKEIFSAILILSFAAAVIFTVLSAKKRMKNYIAKALICTAIVCVCVAGHCVSEPGLSVKSPCTEAHITRSAADAHSTPQASSALQNGSESLSGSYTASIRSEKFHLPSCSSAGRISDENRLWFDSRDDAVSAGYSPCSICLP